MELKMYEFDGSAVTWVCAESSKQAINIFKNTCGEDVWQDGLDCYGDEAVREMSDDETFTYYPDGVEPDKDTIGNHIKKYCNKPDMFASSEF